MLFFSGVISLSESNTGKYVRENLRTVARFSDNAEMCYFVPEQKLVVRRTGLDIADAAKFRKLQDVRNDHLVGILYVLDDSGSCEIIREYIQGDVLSKLLDRGKPFSEKLTGSIARDICEGLSAMHEAGFTHRDITPDNIIVTREGVAVITDFDIVRSSKPDQPADTQILGTPGFAAPEQFGFAQSDARTDIYAVGVLINMMLTGKLPKDKLAPGRYGAIVRKCTSPDPDKRYPSAKELEDAVTRVATGTTAADRFVQAVPGLRSPHTPVVVLSVIAYIAFLIVTMAVFASAPDGKFALVFLSWFLTFPVPYFLMFNILDIWNRIIFTRRARKRNQRIIYTLLGIISIIGGLLIFSAAHAPSV